MLIPAVRRGLVTSLLAVLALTEPRWMQQRRQKHVIWLVDVSQSAGSAAIERLTVASATVVGLVATRLAEAGGLALPPDRCAKKSARIATTAHWAIRSGRVARVPRARCRLPDCGTRDTRAWLESIGSFVAYGVS